MTGTAAMIQAKARERQAAELRRVAAWRAWRERGGDAAADDAAAGVNAAGLALAESAAAVLAMADANDVNPAARIASAYLPMRTEIDPLPLLMALGRAGAATCLPVVAGRGTPLQFRAWSKGCPTVAAGFGTREPAPTQATVVPNLLLVPLLAFDGEGYRLGYGGGFYDRTLRELRKKFAIAAVGVAFDEQEIDAVPHLDYDEPLDAVATPSGLRRFVRPRQGAGA